MSHKTHVLVLGGTGFIGTALVKELLASQEYRVSVLVNKSAPYRTFEDCNLIPGQLETFDLSGLKHDPPELIFHLARIAGRSDSGRNKSAQRGKKANQRLLMQAQELFPSCKWLYVSGSLMYGNHGDETVFESTAHNPIAYAKEYSIAEQPFVQGLSEGRVMMVHPPWIVGRASWFKYFYLHQSELKNCIPKYGSGKEWMNLIHLKDCAGMIRHYAENAAFGNAYNLFGPEAITADAFLEKLSTRLSLPIKEFDLAELEPASAEALSSSIRLGTLYPEIKSSYSLKYSSVDNILEDVLLTENVHI
ncbi:NAD(P)-dependent oxidoreductase [Salibacteraceae bacterium]|jgi:nucleoside-diphosphate-sugar epimerase|nr:NAD(P)-dependent oxidoreductase [Salibacteraceae bacterium]